MVPLAEISDKIEQSRNLQTKALFPLAGKILFLKISFPVDGKTVSGSKHIKNLARKWSHLKSKLISASRNEEFL